MDISDISLSFRLLTSIIPEKFYVLNEIEKISRFIKNKNEKSPKFQVKKNSKKGKKVHSKAELLDSNDSINNGSQITKDMPACVPVDSSEQQQSLKEKLAFKIDQLRQMRKSYSKQELIEKRKQKPKPKQKKKRTVEMKGIPSSEPEQKQSNEASPQLFNVDFGEKKKVKSIDSKALLLKAEQSSKKLEELKVSNPEKYEEVTASSKLNKMIKQAEGQVVKNDLKLLKKTVKKKEVIKKKKSQEWKKREEALEKEMAMRQKKRNQNIQEKKIDKKKRPGF